MTLLGRHGDCPVALAAEPGPADPDRTAVSRRRFRQKQFESGRRCAAAALGLIGRGESGAVGADRSGIPVWPVGAVGSIAHASGLCVAAAASSRCCSGIGIDCETNEPLDLPTCQVVLTRMEAGRIARSRWNCRPTCDWPMLYFCIKESVYKAQSAQDADLFEFQDVEISFEGRSSFSARCRTPLGGMLTGRYAVSADHILALAVARDQRPERAERFA